jgi:hypothetical protein
MKKSLTLLVYSNLEYEKMVETFLISRKYSNQEDIQVLYYTLGFESSLEYPNLIKKRWEIDENKMNFNFYKPELIVDALQEYEEVIYMDSDILLGRRFDVESLRNPTLEHPLACAGPLEFVWAWYTENGKTIRCEVENLMAYFEVEGRTSPYMWTSMISCNRNCISFLEEWNSMHENETLRESKRFYFPFHDESSFNALFWKREHSHCLDLIFFNTHKFSSLARVEMEEDFSHENRDYDPIYTKDDSIYETCRNSSVVQFYHGMKSDYELQKTINWMQGDKKMLVRIEESRESYVPSVVRDMKVGVEIGVFKGQFSKILLEKWNGTLYLVDPWRALGDEYEDSSNHSQHVTAYQEAMENVKGFEDRAFMIRALSTQAANLFTEESLDFVYIDGNHAYDFVKEDIETWWPKLKKGGALMGHDYLNMEWYKDLNGAPNRKDKYIYASDGEYFGVFGVNPAVDEFCAKNDLEGVVTGEWFGSFVIKKP